ncbi:cyclic nucleotide-binding domain-containing protein [Brachyspira murdochii]|uniref:Putative transcriptional regulator, Crp/Fnr family n=1 Tax=Brachyspira murdochii (strain ATCC 51284 / DSM 12563 / 56-150) TaxID=526224 RepID=D5U9F4_BRAM5|nr:cyclic nucleotide-binding domain-containing protein [Brachyspira murdochii]ADG71327.1 putative transcriptional regulator, Crp/Fnr family [Brachyspira murdochii DSM 12563]
MIKYNKIEFKKSSIIFIYGENAKNFFYIISKGSAVSYNYFDENYNIYHKKGDIIGLVNAAVNVPYFETVKAEEDTEVMEININELDKITNIHLIKKLYDHLTNVMEIRLNQYFYIFSKEKNIPFKKESDILKIAEVYKNNGYDDAAYKMYNKYIELNGESKEIKKIMSKIKPSNTASLVIDGIYKLEKGTCIFTELESADKLYIILSGKVGIYTMFNSKIITRTIYTDNEIINGYNSLANNKMLITTAIAIEDTIIKIFKKEDMLELVKTDKELRVRSIKFLSMRIYTIMRSINTFSINGITSKVLLILESFIRMERLFKETNTIKSKYNIYDIFSMIGVEENEYSLREIKKIKSIDIDKNGNIIFPDIRKFMREYKKYKNINSSKTE